MNEEHQKLCSSEEWADHLQTDVLPRVLADVDLGSDLLEIGPGPGAATDFLRHRVRRLTALEQDPGTADQLARRFAGANVTVAVGDCTQATFDDESFDSVASFTMLHHIPTPALQHALLMQAHRVLRPGGVLVGSDSLASNDLHHFHADDTYNPIDPARLLVQLQVLGFDRIFLGVGMGLTFCAYKPPSP